MEVVYTRSEDKIAAPRFVFVMRIGGSYWVRLVEQPRSGVTVWTEDTPFEDEASALEAASVLSERERVGVYAQVHWSTR